MKKTILLPRELGKVFADWCKTNRLAGWKSAAAGCIIGEALTLPVYAKKAVSRDHVGLEDMRGGKAVTFNVAQSMVDAVEAHRTKYGLPSWGEAFRELLRLGLGLPSPRPSKIPMEYLGTGRARIGLAGRQRIAKLVAAGHSDDSIAAVVGVSRQWVNWCRQELGQ